jgi:hypothetical protein
MDKRREDTSVDLVAVQQVFVAPDQIDVRRLSQLLFT